MASSEFKLEIRSGVFGVHYELALPFLDKRGSMIEGAVGFFKDPKNVNIGFSAVGPGVEQITLDGKPPETLKLTISPLQTLLKQEPMGSIDDFRALVAGFCDRMGDLYSHNRFKFIGVVYEVQNQDCLAPFIENQFTKLSPVLSCAADSIANARITYIEDEYRMHVSLGVNKSRTAYTLTFDTQRIRSIEFRKAAELVEECYKRLQNFLGDVRVSKGEGT